MTKKFWITTATISGALLLGFVIITIVLACLGYAPLGVDSTIAQWAYDVRGEKGGATYWFFRIITELGYTYFAIFIVLLMGIIWRFNAKTWFFGGTLVFAWVVQKVLKLIFMRERPDEALRWMTETTSSFPSGHSIVVVCVFVLLTYFIITSPNTQKWLKYVMCGISASAIFLVAISRLILGVHYFTDVLGGLFLGGAIAGLSIILYNIFMQFVANRKANVNNTTAENLDKPNTEPATIEPQNETKKR